LLICPGDAAESPEENPGGSAASLAWVSKEDAGVKYKTRGYFQFPE